MKTLKEAREKILEEIIEKFGKGIGENLTKSKLSIWDVRDILYKHLK